MTPADAKVKAEEIIEANAQINSSHQTNGHMAKAAGMASLVIDQATQLEAALANLTPAKAEKGPAHAPYVAKPSQVLPSSSGRDTDRDGPA